MQTCVINLQDLGSGLALLLSNFLEGRVAGKRRVGGTETRVGGAVNALLFAVIEELR